MICTWNVETQRCTNDCRSVVISPCNPLLRWQMERSWTGWYLTLMKCACRHFSFVRESLAPNTQTHLIISATGELSTQTLGTLSAVLICGSMLWTCSRVTWTPSAPWRPPACSHSPSSSPLCCRTEPKVSWGHQFHLRIWWGSFQRVFWKLSGRLNIVDQQLWTRPSSARPSQSSCTSFVF